MAAGGTADDKNNYPGVKRWYRIVFAGDPGIGKTSLLLRLVKDEFHDPPPTILGEANRFLKVIVLEDKTKIGMELWDTAGMERHHSVTDHYYRNSHAVLFCYDTTDKGSFQDIGNWTKEVHTRLGEWYGGMSKFLVGTKIDLFDSAPTQERVDRDVASKKASAMRPPWPFFETSAKTNTNIDDLFQEVAKSLATHTGEQKRNTIQVDNFVQSQQPENSGCCKKK